MKRSLTLFGTFCWIATVTLGGGMAQLPLIMREFVERRHWLTEQEMLDTVAVMQSLPGLITVNLAVLIGYRIAGIVGAVSATLGAVLTPVVAVALLAVGLARLGDSSALDHAFLGVRAATAALIMMSLGKLAKKALDRSLAWALAVGAFVAAAILGVDIMLVVLAGMAVGLVYVVKGAVDAVRRK